MHLDQAGCIFHSAFVPMIFFFSRMAYSPFALSISFEPSIRSGWLNCRLPTTTALPPIDRMYFLRHFTITRTGPASIFHL
ncbi:uncharacterized protein BJX67DRAFT_14896 [Aspergillus lucknowensis]|uniref:Secreted protein n=1 Tax=Aspergillus lucknowensis TaxID=176173 RepID=A0ABR4M7S8_9EURO